MPSPTTAPAAWTLARIGFDEDDHLVLRFTGPHLPQLRRQARQQIELAGIQAAEQADKDGVLQAGLTAAQRLIEVERAVRECERSLKLAEVAHEEAVDTPHVPLADINATREAVEQARAVLREARAAYEDGRRRLVHAVQVLRRDIKDGAWTAYGQQLADATEQQTANAKTKLRIALGKVSAFLDEMALSMAAKRLASYEPRKVFEAQLDSRLVDLIGVDLLDRLQVEQEAADQAAKVKAAEDERKQWGDGLAVQRQYGY